MNNFSIVSPNIIRNSPLNSSSAKIAHQFSKTQRFLSPNPQCPNAFYTYDSQLSRRRASIGFGMKHDFTKTSIHSPPCNLYNLASDFQAKDKGRSFGCARDRSPDQSYLVPQLHRHPGPGHYENQFQTKSPVSWTARPKTNDMIANHLSYKEAPGPGSYKEVELIPTNGRFKVAKFQDVKLATIHPRTARFEKIKESPGPHSYKEGDNMSEAAKYVLSQRKGHGTRAFQKEARFTLDYWKQSKNPGPGHYEKTSEFGVYGDAKYYKTLQGFTRN